jgi:hypothetical protein
MRQLCDCHAAVCRAVHITTVVVTKGICSRSKQAQPCNSRYSWCVKQSLCISARQHAAEVGKHTRDWGLLYNPYAAAQVDAFADGPGSGNPAGVCLLAGEQLTSMTDKLRQKVAEKVNLSETAFLEPVSERVSFGAAQYAHPCSACGVWHVGGCPGVMLVGRNRFLASIRAAVWLSPPPPPGMCACCAGVGGWVGGKN